MSACVRTANAPCVWITKQDASVGDEESPALIFGECHKDDHAGLECARGNKCGREG